MKEGRTEGQRDRGTRGLRTHHVDDQLAEALSLPLAQVLEDVTVLLVEQLEAHGQVVVLQHRLVVVHQGQLRVCGRESVTHTHTQGLTHSRPKDRPSSHSVANIDG